MSAPRGPFPKVVGSHVIVGGELAPLVKVGGPSPTSTGTLGGVWAPYELQGNLVPTDAAPGDEGSTPSPGTAVKSSSSLSGGGLLPRFASRTRSSAARPESTEHGRVPAAACVPDDRTLAAKKRNSSPGDVGNCTPPALSAFQLSVVLPLWELCGLEPSAPGSGVMSSGWSSQASAATGVGDDWISAQSCSNDNWASRARRR
mmetsp:Transcript_108324/g.305409  ORF Transcript_108324/g.305409 Transcript_108324/m.305409 type:complete len:202 (-) Transcript_108324:970-1575(-)